MNKVRGFEVLSNKEGILPVRSTIKAGGYDFFANDDYVIKPNHVELIGTNIKAYMQDNEMLLLFNRSGNPIKRNLVLTNGVGLIDADYYNNQGNEGHIMFQFMNIGTEDCVIKKGDKIGQGSFVPFMIADNDTALGVRTGGFGSTGN